MKLISFAVISFLAITVSAYPHQDPNERDVEQSQGASSQSEQGDQSDTTQILLEPQSTIDQSEQEDPQQWLWNKFQNLLDKYKEKQNLVVGLDLDIKKTEEEISNMESRIKEFEGPGKTILQLHLHRLNKKLTRTWDSKETLEREMEDFLKELHDLVREISALDGPQG
ncbi:hypothetical protein BASA50_006594 [Batrachochytrium salamandrivorans]|uniref:Uncharacterized protein n=1 Tax=Batrachochytrium salamandrivorans TaxID=1357716 RepID=A0ABQ8F936_9FUNG|nr:hypothetical protein BASA50_006594 [Batrachochytrium salamandrivorans]